MSDPATPVIPCPSAASRACNSSGLSAPSAAPMSISTAGSRASTPCR